MPDKFLIDAAKKYLNSDERWMPPPGVIKSEAVHIQDNQLETWVEPVPKLGTPARKEWEERQKQLTVKSNDGNQTENLHN